MSSTIKLYEHNQKAYDALLDMLGERDRACVIKPTGTGKFVIIAKMVQDNPDNRSSTERKGTGRDSDHLHRGKGRFRGSR